MKKKLLVVGHSLIIALNRSLMREVNRRGVFEVTAASPAFFHTDFRPMPIEPEPAVDPLPLVSIDAYGTRSVHGFFYNPFQLRRLFDQGRFDYVYVWAESYTVSGYQLARACQKRNIPYGTFTGQNLVKRYPFPFSYFDRNALSRAKRIFPAGELVKRCMRKKGYAVPDGTVVGMHVDTERFQPADEAVKREAKRKLGLSDAPVVGFMGRFTLDKGCDVFMQAVDGLPREMPWNVLMLGGGVMEGEIRRWIEQRNLTDRAKVLQVPHAEVPGVLQAMDLVLCPSQTRPHWVEQFGRMLVEVMATGVPVVGSSSGEIPYVIGEAGLVVPERDVPAWTSAALRLLTDPSLRSSLSTLGLSRSSHFSSASLASRIEANILEDLGLSG